MATLPATITPAMARRIEIWPTDRLVPYARNARTHSADQVAQIAASIVEFGFTNPILVDSMDGIIAGHGRLLAARKLGLTEVPVVVLDHLSETQRRAYVLADNKLAMNAGWDEKMLASELHDLEKDGMDLALVGFSDEELEALLKEGDAPPPDVADEVPEPPVQPVTQPGDVWLIGKHRLICGDCRDEETIRALFGDVKANVVVTSPPYATQREYDASSGFKPVRPDEYVEWFGPVAGGVESILVSPRFRELAVQIWPIDKLIPYARNARTHTDEQVAQVAASIVEFGWTNPILVGADRVIIAGHARLAAARKLRMDEVPVIVLDGLSETQRRALVLADNRLAMSAGWDEEMLRVELAALQEDAFNLELVGFTDDELEEFLREPETTEDGLTDPDAVPPEQETVVTVRGDVWVLGQHRLLCGDATQMADIEKVLAGGLADMVFTDPPYNVAYEGKTAKKLTIDNDALGGKFYEFLREASANMLAMTKGSVYMCMSSSELHTLFQAFTDAGGHWSTFVIWAKHHFTLGRSDYQRMYEPILYGWRKGTEHFWCGDRNQGDVWSIKRPMANLEHPTMKPVELVERAIRNSSKTRDTILDPFGGSGTTLIACHKTGRQARVIELEPKYCDVIIRRWQEFTGQEAKLETDGRTYNAVAAERSAVAA